MKRLLVLCASALLMASAADAADGGYGARSADPGVRYAAQYPAWRRGGHHGWRFWFFSHVLLLSASASDEVVDQLH